MASANKKYAQPYSSRHVIGNTVDPIRSDEPTFIKSWPRFLFQLYDRQTQFTLDILNTFKQSGRKSKSASKKSVSAKSPRRRKASPSTPPTPLPDDQANFKTFATADKSKSTKSPTAEMPVVPSDFEHIFHYSEAS